MHWNPSKNYQIKLMIALYLKRLLPNLAFLLTGLLMLIACETNADKIRQMNRVAEENQASPLIETPMPTPSPTPIRAELSVFDLRDGDCFDFLGGRTFVDGAEYETLELVPCSTDWGQRVLNSFVVKQEGPLPEDAFFEKAAFEKCDRKFTFFMKPLVDSWAAGDRSIQCIQESFGYSKSDPSLHDRLVDSAYLKQGECYDEPPVEMEEFIGVEIVDCGGEWVFKVITIVNVEKHISLPGHSYLYGLAEEECDDSYTHLLPLTQEKWNLGQRWIHCLQRYEISSLVGGIQSDFRDGLYVGTVHNTTHDIESKMLLKLSNVGGELSGRVVVLYPLEGDGRVNGSVEESGAINFDVGFTLDDVPYSIDFVGTVSDSEEGIDGTYSVEPTKEEGTWSVNYSPHVNVEQGQVHVWLTELQESVGDVRPSGIFLLVYFDLVNMSENQLTVSDSDFELVDEQGDTYSISFDGTLGYVNGDSSLFYLNERIVPGETLEVVEIFDLPRSVIHNVFTLKFNESPVATVTVDPVSIGPTSISTPEPNPDISDEAIEEVFDELFWITVAAAGISRDISFEEANARLKEVLDGEFARATRVTERFGVSPIEDWPYCISTLGYIASALVAADAVSPSEAGLYWDGAIESLEGVIMDADIASQIGLGIDAPKPSSRVKCSDLAEEMEEWVGKQ